MTPPRRRALVGVLGHVDHGKTALVRALTGTDTDRLPEERARGISIVLGFARLEAPCGAEVELVDAPGHERFVRAMAAGASAVDAALLVVDAREGVRAQTAEHAEIAALLGVRRGAVAVARRDLADPGAARAAAEGARALLRRVGLGDGAWPLVETSAATGEGLPALAAALGGLARDGAPGEAGEAWLPLDRAFALAGVGVVATGALRRGRLRVGDAVEVLPRGLRAAVRGLHSHGRALAEAGPGQRVAVALRGLGRGDVAPGDALASPRLGLAASALLDARVRVLASAPRALVRGETLRLLCGTREVGARLRLLGRDRAQPDEEIVAQLALDAPLAVPARERFVLRSPSPARTVGGGEVLDPAPGRRRRGRDAPALRALAGAADPLRAAALLLRGAGPRGMPAAAAARAAGLPAPALLARLDAAEAVQLPGGATLLHAEEIAALESKLLAAVEAAERADPLGGGPAAAALLRAAVPRGAPAEAVAARLVARGALALADGRLRSPGLDTARLLPEADRALVAAVEAAYRRAGLSPPEPASAAPGADPRRVADALRLLLRSGALVRVAQPGRAVLFHREALAAARRSLRGALAGSIRGLTVGECDALLGITRRHGVPLLECLDATGFTRRVGDRRVLAERPAPPRA